MKSAESKKLKGLRTFLWILGMMIAFPLIWGLSRPVRDDFRLFRKDKQGWQERQAEQFAQDFIRDYKEILDRFD